MRIAVCSSVLLSLFAAELLAGCEDGGSDPAPVSTDLELVGTWTTSFDSEEVITNTAWNGYPILEYSNSQNVAYTQTPDGDKFNPGKFNKLVWTEPKGNSTYYCWIAYGQDSLPLAKASTLVADDKDLEGMGCAGYSWTKLTRK